ncbi:LuxR C-terminal-related transcriptional regulator [Knoellia koreensis]|uniref:Helix-turn-helix transcriptional regulator n=1 Tax=Knoellia koreensis TaxID=2730921 RepID=A0A849HNE3_9MICO|nr:helix-turn-helix transcriptional regulator [Knoellia sp. DB2414S]
MARAKGDRSATGQQGGHRASSAGGSGADADPPLPRTSALDLTDSALEQAVTRVFLAVVQHPDPTRALLVAQGLETELVDRSLEVLSARGLVRLHGGGHIEVVPPDVSLPALAMSYERRARETRSAAHELAQVFFHARASRRTQDTSAIQVLTSLDEVSSATSEAVATATEQIRSFRTMSPRTRAVIDSPLHSHSAPTLGPDGTPLPCYAVFDPAILEADNILAVLRAREEGGELARFSNAVPFSAIIVDDTAAVVDLSEFDGTGYGSLFVRSRPAVLGLISLFDRLWELGHPLDQSAARASRHDQTILSMLATGVTDATIARQVGISQRTVERRVRALMDELGANTRFQAGVLAARRGLL